MNFFRDKRALRVVHFLVENGNRFFHHIFFVSSRINTHPQQSSTLRVFFCWAWKEWFRRETFPTSFFRVNFLRLSFILQHFLADLIFLTSKLGGTK